jgi:hypothetical protein
MIQPRSYPELMAKALVLEPEPFAVMTHDDQPIIEGLVLTALVGALVGIARVVRGLLFSWAMPPAVALESVARQAVAILPPQVEPAALALVDGWQRIGFYAGYDTGWARLISLIWVPFAFMALWLLAGLLLFAIGRMLGGTGSLRQVLGASALMVAPATLLWFTAIPFVAVSPLLPLVWGMLMLYRAAQMAHELTWQAAAWATVIAATLLLVIGMMAAASIGLLVVWL